MSELIDRVADVSKISGEINQIIDLIKKAGDEITALNEYTKKLTASTRLAKNNEDLAKSATSLNDIIIKGGQAMTRYEVEVEKLKQKTEQLTTSEKQAAIEIAKARLELQAAQKATKDAAIAKIELDANNGKLVTSYKSLERELKAAQVEFKNMDIAELKTAKGKGLAKKINDLNSQLKQADASMGNYQRNVGNYASALDGLKPGLGGLATKLFEIADSAKKNAKDWDEMGNSVNLGIKSMGQAPAGLAKITAGFQGLGSMIGTVWKAFIAQPIGLVIAGIVAVVSQVVAAFKESEERTNKLSVAMANFKPVMKLIGDLFEVLADVVIKVVSGFGQAFAWVMRFLNIDPKSNSDKFVEAEKLKQKAIKGSRDLAERSSKLDAEIADKRAIIADKESYSFAQRMQALKEAKKLEKELSEAKLSAARNELKAVLAQNALDDNNAEANQRKADAVVKFNNAKKENAELNRKLSKEEQKLIRENEQDLKDQAEAAKAAYEKIIAARRRLKDSQLAIMAEGVEKEKAISNENYNRQIEDLKRNGELTKSLAKNLKIAHNNELQKIDEEAKKKKLDDEIKADELTLENMKKAGDDTLAFEKSLLAKKMAAEIKEAEKSGKNVAEIQLKYQYLSLDLEAANNDKKIKLVEDYIKKQSDAMQASYNKASILLKEDFANTKQTAKDKADYEKKMADLQLKYLLDGNNAQISALNNMLDTTEMSEDKRAELSKKISDLQIANENAVADATIEANQKKIDADKAATDKRKEIAQQLVYATMEVFTAIADFQKQQSDEAIASLEDRQDAVDSLFDEEQERLDNAIMSDETRVEKQKKLDKDKEKSDKIIADKIRAEKIKQAKWDKAQGLVSTAISTAQSIMAIWADLTMSAWVKPIFTALAAATGAVQIATIASQQIPAYAKGTDNHPGGLALVGEERPEVVVTPKGDVLLATAPTVADFDAGTKVYKSVSDYENFMAQQAVNQVVFDYDKLAASIPSNEFEFDGNGLLIARDKRGNRRTLINRKCKL